MATPFVMPAEVYMFLRQAAAFLFVFYFVSTCSCQTVSVDTALEVIKSDTAIGVVEWQCNMKVQEISSGGTVIQALPNSISSMVRVDPLSMCYLANIDAVIPWQGGKSSLSARRKGISFDGRVFRGWVRRGSGGMIPDESVIAKGAISEVKNEVCKGDHFELWDYSLGMGFVFPFFDSFEEEPSVQLPTLYEFLIKRRNRKDLGFDETNGVWKFTTELEKLGCALEVRYSPKMRAIVEATWGDQAPLKSWRRWNADIEKIGDRWVPKQVGLVSNSTSPPQLITFKYSRHKVIPKPTDKDFQVEFPTNTMIKDHIKKRVYRN